MYDVTTWLIKKTNSNNSYVGFNTFIAAGRGSLFLLWFALAISFDRTHPLFSSHTVPNLALRSLPTISLVDPLPFLSYSKFHNLTYLGIDVSTHDMTKPPQTALNYHILNLHNNTHPITKNISRHTINQFHLTHHPDHATLQPTQPKQQVPTFYNRTAKLV